MWRFQFGLFLCLFDCEQPTISGFGHVVLIFLFLLAVVCTDYSSISDVRKNSIQIQI